MYYIIHMRLHMQMPLHQFCMGSFGGMQIKLYWSRTKFQMSEIIICAAFRSHTYYGPFIKHISSMNTCDRHLVRDMFSFFISVYLSSVDWNGVPYVGLTKKKKTRNASRCISVFDAYLRRWNRCANYNNCSVRSIGRYCFPDPKTMAFFFSNFN